MTAEQILEGNTLIAQFMGAIVSQPYSKNEEQDGLLFYYPDRTSPDMFRNHSSASIKYHTSWEWLMPVIEKIAKLNIKEHDYDTYYPRTFGMVEGGTNQFMFRLNLSPLFTHDKLIMAAYAAVIHFLKHDYNND